MKAFIGAKIYPVASKPVEQGILLIKNGKIVAVGERIDIPSEATVVECHGKVILPGLIDTHTHVGMWGEGTGENDGNESTNPITPQVRALDSINPEHTSLVDAQSGGVTTVQVTPGSGNPIGGQACVIKTWGKTADDLVIVPYSGMKAALGENPKNSYGISRRLFPGTRMGTAAAIRGALREARSYMLKHEKEAGAERDLRWEPLVAVLRKEVPLRIHAHRADDIVTAVRLAEEFEIDISIEHGTDAAPIANLLAEKRVKVNLGPSFWHRAKIETRSVSFETAGILEKAGVKLSLISDHPFFPVQYMSIAMTMAHAAGMSQEGALRALTIDAADILGVADRVGSLTAGKDADFAIWEGTPYSIRSRVLATYIEGRMVYQLP